MVEDSRFFPPALIVTGKTSRFLKGVIIRSPRAGSATGAARAFIAANFSPVAFAAKRGEPKFCRGLIAELAMALWVTSPAQRQHVMTMIQRGSSAIATFYLLLAVNAF